MKHYITLSQLSSLNACQEQLELFKKTFGERVEVCLKNAKLYGHLFDIDWLSCNLLKNSALAEYDRIEAIARDELKRVTATARAEFNRIEETARAEYKRVTATAWAEYNRITAVIFVKLYLNQLKKDNQSVSPN